MNPIVDRTFAHIVDERDDEQLELRLEGEAKFKKAVEGECSKCGAAKLVRGEDGKTRCTKCAWCEEDADFDGRFAHYLFC